MNHLPAFFYQRDTVTVAKELLGKKLCHFKDGILTAGIITETEAYLGETDPACHTFEGHRSKRVASMYLTGGHAYIYFIYGMHFCFNVVTKSAAEPEAVLIRALSPTDGISLMKKRRDLRQSAENLLCSGPGKLCQALGINRDQDGISLQGSELWIMQGIAFSKIQSDIRSEPRVGIPNTGAAKDWPLRFSIRI